VPTAPLSHTGSLLDAPEDPARVNWDGRGRDVNCAWPRRLLTGTTSSQSGYAVWALSSSTTSWVISKGTFGFTFAANQVSCCCHASHTDT
jgi:hypothetical protein